MSNVFQSSLTRELRRGRPRRRWAVAGAEAGRAAGRRTSAPSRPGRHVVRTRIYTGLSEWTRCRNRQIVLEAAVADAQFLISSPGWQRRQKLVMRRLAVI